VNKFRNRSIRLISNSAPATCTSYAVAAEVTQYRLQSMQPLIIHRSISAWNNARCCFHKVQQSHTEQPNAVSV